MLSPFAWPLTIHFKAYSYLALYQVLVCRSQEFVLLPDDK